MADQGAEGLLSPFLRARRIKAARPYLAGRVLDVGCGSGSLAGYVAPADYVGLDIDAASIELARASHPDHTFMLSQNLPDDAFDTVVALAIIEHVAEPVDFLTRLGGRLSGSSNARVVCTTPHPRMDWIHTIGARVGIFSRSASDEHEELLDRGRLDEVGRASGLRLIHYERFLLGANQLAIFSRS